MPIASESDWNQSEYPMHMMRFLGKKVTERKGNLIVAACFRRIWHLIKTKRGHRAVEVLEEFVEGRATAEELARAKEEAWESCIEIPNPEGKQCPEHIALGGIGLHSFARDMMSMASDAVAWANAREGSGEPETIAQCTLVREVFGNPFRPVTVNLAWLTSTVKRLAQAIYDERAFGRLPILADALEDAGCTSQDILGHLRGGGEHVRGCWVVDLVLGRE